MSVPERRGPLAGTTVVEIAGIGPSPFAGMMLRQLGAQVVLVDRPGGVDAVIDPQGDADLLRVGKRRVELHLKSAEGRAAMLDLLDTADILIEGLRPGVLERLGLGPDRLADRNPALVIGRMTGWGQEGPLADRAGHDLNYISLTGALAAIGPRDGPPVMPLNLLGDFGGGALYLVVGVLAALHEARSTGLGQVVDAAIVDGVAHLMGGVHASMAVGAWTDRRASNYADGGWPEYSVYETADGRHISVTAVEEKFFRELLGALDIPSTSRDRSEAGRERLRAQLAEAFRGKTRDEWQSYFEGSDACVAPVLGLAEAEHHPHITARGTLFRRNGVLQAAPAPRFSHWPRSDGALTTPTEE